PAPHRKAIGGRKSRRRGYPFHRAYGLAATGSGEIGSRSPTTGQAPIVQRPRTPAFHAGNTGSNPVGGASFASLTNIESIPFTIQLWSRGAVWSARRPVKPEVAGSNPVGT